MSNYLFFDSASTTPCSRQSAEQLKRYSTDCFGNPSSSHALGEEAARAIREARLFFANHFNVEPTQVVFTGSGSESDNLAISGVALYSYTKNLSKRSHPGRVIISAIEHPAVRQTAFSLRDFGFEVLQANVDSNGQIVESEFEALLNDDTVLVSIMRSNNIVGSILDVERLAEITEKKSPSAVFHSDCVQAFSKIPVPTAPSPVDLVSLSGHKIHAPKGIGALIMLNPDIAKNKRLRPIVWGGEQEYGIRSGTQSAGLISAFHVAAKETLKNQENYVRQMTELRKEFKRALVNEGLLNSDGTNAKVIWNSPENGMPHIVSLSVPNYPPAPLVRLLEEHHCIVATGSACSSKKAEPDPVLKALGLKDELNRSALRISFCESNSTQDVARLAQAITKAMASIDQLK